MKINNVEVSIDDAIKLADLDNYLIKRNNNATILDDNMINILKKNGINYYEYSDMHLLLFEIESLLNDDYDDELDMVSKQIQEYIYYNETNY